VLIAVLAPSFTAQGVSSIAQGFQSNDDNITPGALVGLVPDNPNTVELSSINNADQLLGVVGDQALIELSDGSNAVQVVTSGVTEALVSDINGEVIVGDKITASPINGVGMKATQDGIVVGTAQDNLESVDITERTIADRNGEQQTVRIGRIPVQVDTFYFVGSGEGSSFVPPFLQDLANSVAGRNVSPLRVLIAALLLFLLFVSIIVLLYSAVRSSIISIGRNPLSQSAVHKSLLQVGLMIVGLLAFTVILVYLILTL
jgi:hypothetical protein